MKLKPNRKFGNGSVGLFGSSVFCTPLIVTFDHLGSNGLLRCILVSVLNIYNLIVHSGSHRDRNVDLNGREVHVRKKDDDLLSKALKTFAILRPQ